MPRLLKGFAGVRAGLFFDFASAALLLVVAVFPQYALGRSARFVPTSAPPCATCPNGVCSYPPAATWATSPCPNGVCSYPPAATWATSPCPNGVCSFPADRRQSSWFAVDQSQCGPAAFGPTSAGGACAQSPGRGRLRIFRRRCR